ncbi:hypothetical protein [Corallococcus exiguus]|uniref:hypothetical protein n=1 Tax=Corallococcus exiguus TaxID=83462 RepID=UPI00147138BA|nr:hypothetical protein [Corallococcus exiguus]NNB85016.1 hypothetical protein [Corallococcus exiguus]
MRNQMFACILAVSVFLVGGKAEALPGGWHMGETGNRVILYDQNHEAVWAGYFDEEGKWHESTYTPRGGSSGDQGETMGDINSSADYVLVNITRRVGGIIVFDPTKRVVVFEVRGGVAAGTTVRIPANRLSDTVQLVATVDDKGAALDVAFFKRAVSCGSRSFWVSR